MLSRRSRGGAFFADVAGVTHACVKPSLVPPTAAGSHFMSTHAPHTPPTHSGAPLEKAWRAHHKRAARRLSHFLGDLPARPPLERIMTVMEGLSIRVGCSGLDLPPLIPGLATTTDMTGSGGCGDGVDTAGSGDRLSPFCGESALLAKGREMGLRSMHRAELCSPVGSVCCWSGRWAVASLW